MAGSGSTGKSVQNKNDILFSDEENESNENNVNESIRGNYKCCIKKKCTVVVCINCYAVYHKSCIEKCSKKFHKIDDYKVKCCENTNPYFNNVMMCKLQTENNLIKKLMSEMEDKNCILKENNRLLLEKIKYVEEQKNLQKHVTKTNPGQTYSSVIQIQRPQANEMKLESIHSSSTSNNDALDQDLSNNTKSKQKTKNSSDINTYEKNDEEIQNQSVITEERYQSKRRLGRNYNYKEDELELLKLQKKKRKQVLQEQNEKSGYI